MLNLSLCALAFFNERRRKQLSGRLFYRGRVCTYVHTYFSTSLVARRRLPVLPPGNDVEDDFDAGSVTRFDVILSLGGTYSLSVCLHTTCRSPS